MAKGKKQFEPPNWLQKLINKSSGRDLNKYRMLDDLNLKKDSVISDKYDKIHFRDLVGNAEELGKLVNEEFVDAPTWAQLVQDEYLSFWKASPHLRKDIEMKPSHKVNRATMDKVVESTEWQKLRTFTELDEWGSAMAALEFGIKLKELFEEQEELQEIAKAQEGVEATEKDLEEFIEQAGQAKDAEQYLDELEQKLKDYEGGVQTLDEAIKGGKGALAKAGQQAANQAGENAQDIDGMLNTFGTDAGALQRMDGKKRMELAARIRDNRKLRELAEMVGRFKRLAMGEQARRIIHGRDEVHDIEVGDDLSRVLPSEFANLAIPETEVVFYERYADKRLLQYSLRGTENVARGAIIAMIDNSGSMSGAREMWAKALALALLEIARSQGRDFYGIHFSSNYDDLMEFSFPKGIAQPEEALDFAEYFLGGGTDFEKPISRGVEVLNEQFNSEGSQKGDLVLITDGECAVSEEWKIRYENAKEELAFRMYGCLVGYHSETVKMLSDATYNITDLATASGDEKEIFGYV